MANIMENSDAEILCQEFHAIRERLADLWDEIGFTATEKGIRGNKVYITLTEQLNKLEEKENKIKDDLLRSINFTGEKLCQITKELQVSNVAEPEMTLTLLQLENYLKEQLSSFECEAELRRKKVEELRQHEKELCSRLSEELSNLPDEKIPSLDTVNYMQCVVNTLQTECDQRYKTFKSLKSAILLHMEDLNISPSSTFERKIVTEVEDLFTLSEGNMKDMKRLCKELQAKVVKNREKEADLREEISLLWDRLSVDLEQRNLFLRSLTHNPTRNIPKLESKLQDLKELRHQNLGHFINQLRRELEDWWDKCYVSEDEKEGFLPYMSDEYTEDDLELHEQEVKKFRIYYQKNKNIFQKLEAWKDLWMKVTELDERAHDPNRLFGNRGCALLKEEKERKKVNSELPRLEKDIEKLIALWESETGMPFLVCGQTLHNFIKSHWEDYNEKKRREKEMRQVTRNKQLQIEARLGTRRSPRKRQNQNNADMLRNSKYLRTNDHTRTPGTGSGMSSGSSILRSTSRTNLHQPKLSHRCGIAKILLRDQSIHSSNSDNNKTFSSEDISSYDKFTEGIQGRLNDRENVRSSALPNIVVYKSTAGGLSTPKQVPLTMPASARTRRQPMAAYNHQYGTPTSSRMEPTMILQANKGAATVPRRRSARLDSTRRMGNTTKGAVPSPSPSMRSRCSPYSTTRLTTPMRNRLHFLM